MEANGGRTTGLSFTTKPRCGKEESGNLPAEMARLPKGKVESAEMGITMDLSATFAAVAGAKRPGHRFDGIDPPPTGEVLETSDRSFFWRIQRSNREDESGSPRPVEIPRRWRTTILFDLKSHLGTGKFRFQHPRSWPI